MPVRIWISVVMILAVGMGCGHIKEFAPIRLDPISLRVPNQQRVVAQSIEQAVEQASTGIDLKRYSGKTVRVEVNGVFPHTRHDLLDYVATSIEWKAAKAGLIVLERPDPDLVRDQIVVGGDAASVNPNADRYPKPDIRLVASVDWGGIDLKDQEYIKGGTLFAQIFFAIIVPPLGIVLFLALDSTAHTFTMIGRVRMTLRAFPTAEGLAAAIAVGEGESSIVIDPESDSGYTLRLAIPREDY